MKLDTITMDRAQAQDAYMAYRASVRENGGSPEDAMLAKGYRALALGHSLVDVRAALRAGALGNDGFPRMAIARADTPRVVCHIQRRNGDDPVTIQLRSAFMTPGGHRKNGWATSPQPSFEKSLLFDLTGGDFPGQNLPAKLGQNWGSDVEAYAIVPNVPATLKPEHSLTGYHILFEVEQWHAVAPRAPRDPALLKHIGGDLYAVLAIWDLTALERSVIAGTRVRRS